MLAKVKTPTPVEPRTPLVAPGQFTTMDASSQKARSPESLRSMGPLKRFVFVLKCFTLIVNLSC